MMLMEHHVQDDRKGIAGDEAGGVGSDWDMEDSELDPWDPSKGFTQECDMAGLAFWKDRLG